MQKEQLINEMAEAVQQAFLYKNTYEDVAKAALAAIQNKYVIVEKDFD